MISSTNRICSREVITDQTIPGITGVELSRRILQLRPNMPIILCTGYSSLISEEQAQTLGIQGFAMKPPARKNVADLIRKILVVFPVSLIVCVADQENFKIRRDVRRKSTYIRLAAMSKFTLISL